MGHISCFFRGSLTLMHRNQIKHWESRVIDLIIKKMFVEHRIMILVDEVKIDWSLRLEG